MIGRLIERNPRFANWIWGFTPPEHGTIVLVHRRVYIVPTRLGWLFAATLTILLIGSINYALAGFGLTFLLAGMGIAGMVQAAQPRAAPWSALHEPYSPAIRRSSSTSTVAWRSTGRRSGAHERRRAARARHRRRGR